ncbi:Transcription initiation factor TFIID subunit 5, partial [Pichia californica]
GSQRPQQNASNSDMPFNLNRLVLEYLTRKGYHQTEATLRIEATKIPGAQTFNLTNSNSNFESPTTVTSDRSNLQFQQQQFLLKQNVSKQRQFDEDPKMFARAYLLYRSWCENSLEMYKYELEKLLFPFFIYSYLSLIQRKEPEEAHNFLLKFRSDHSLSHTQDIKILLTITLPDHLTENKYAKLFLANKYKMNISNTSLNLVLGFLNENQAIGGGILVRFLNNNFEMHTQLEVTTSSNDALENLEGIPEIYQLIKLGPDDDNENFKSNKSTFIQENEKPLKLGPYPNDEEFTKELEAELKHKDEAAKKSDETSTAQSKQKQSLMDEYNENFKTDPKNEDSPARDTLPLPQKSVYDLKRAIQEIQDSRSRIRLSSSSYSHLNNTTNNTRTTFISQPSLPSVCMYTFHNTNNDLTSLSFHPDSTMIAGGFQDSFVKLWSIDGSPLRSVLKKDPYNVDIDNDPTNGGLPTNTSRKLIGHSGPVYGLSFSPDGHYLLSSSADSTVRLWSLDTYSALVSYKGHGGAGGSSSPVWDVQFSPLGHYFATASHDQTARLWSCDHIYPLRIFAGHLNDVDIVRFHPNGTYLFTGSSDKTVRMWDVARAESVRLFVGHTSPISDIACSPDGRWLATASVSEENYLNTSFGVNNWASSIGGGFTPSGGSVSNPSSSDSKSETSDKNDKSTDDDKTKGSATSSGSKEKENDSKKLNNNQNVSFTGSVIHIWDIASGRKLKTMRGHASGGIHSLAWSRGGEVLVSGGADGSVRVWDAKRGTVDAISGGQPERFLPISKSSLNSHSSKEGKSNDLKDGSSSAGGRSEDVKNSVINNYSSSDHMGVYFTKKTPVYKVEFTRRNLCLAAGPFM